MGGSVREACAPFDAGEEGGEEDGIEGVVGYAAELVVLEDAVSQWGRIEDVPPWLLLSCAQATC